jgi:hypothetical protein
MDCKMGKTCANWVAVPFHVRSVLWRRFREAPQTTNAHSLPRRYRHRKTTAFHAANRRAGQKCYVGFGAQDPWIDR